MSDSGTQQDPDQEKLIPDASERVKDLDTDDDDDADDETEELSIPPGLADAVRDRTDVTEITLLKDDEYAVHPSEMPQRDVVSRQYAACSLSTDEGGLNQLRRDEFIYPPRRWRDVSDHEHSDDCVTECDCEHNDITHDQCGCWYCCCDVHSATGEVFCNSVQSVEDLAAAVDAASESGEEGEEISVFGKIVDVSWPEQDGGWPSLEQPTITVADTTGVVQIPYDSRLPVPDPIQNETVTAGTEVFVSNVTVSADGSVDYSELTRVKIVGEQATTAPRTHFREQSDLTRAEDVFKNADKIQEACEWVADVLTREWAIETPFGDDEIWMYDDAEDSETYGIYVDNGDQRIRSIIDDYLPKGHRNNRNKNEIVSLVRDSTRVVEDAFGTGTPDIESRRWSVAVENGVIHLGTGELYDHHPAWRATTKLPVRYDPDTEKELGDAWENFLDETMKNPADKETFLYMLGMSLTRCYPTAAAFFIIGPGGNGKSVLESGVKDLFGDAASSFNLTNFTGESDFSGSAMMNSHLIVDDDATGVKLHDITPLKTHSGGEEGEINVKHEKKTSYQNYATITCLTNKPPMFNDPSEGLKRRIYPILMPFQFKSDPSEFDKDMVKPARDREELLAELTNEEEIQQLLAVAVSYAQDIYRHQGNDLPVGRTREERWELYDYYSDGIQRFWSDCAVSKPGARISVAAWYQTYVNYCERYDIDPQAKKGRNNFWSLSDRCSAVDYKRDGVWVNSNERGIEHVTISSDGLDYAPDWVVEEWGDEIAANESTVGNRLDKVTPIQDLSGGYCTVRGRVKSKQEIEQDGSHRIEIMIEDRTHGIDVVEFFDPDETPVLEDATMGDVVEFERAILSHHQGVPQLQLKPATSLRVVEDTTEIEVDSEFGSLSGYIDESDGRNVSQAEIRQTISDVTARNKTLNSVAKDAVEELDIEIDDDAQGDLISRVRHQAEKMAESGDIICQSLGDDESQLRNKLREMADEYGRIPEPDAVVEPVRDYIDADVDNADEAVETLKHDGIIYDTGDGYKVV